jgi:hypothetical protein
VASRNEAAFLAQGAANPGAIDSFAATVPVMPSIRATSFRSAVAILITALACIVGSSAQARAEAAGSGVARSVTRPSIKAPKVVVEGARFAVTVAVPSARRATTVQLQFHDKHDYDFESTLS